MNINLKDMEKCEDSNYPVTGSHSNLLLWDKHHVTHTPGLTSFHVTHTNSPFPPFCTAAVCGKMTGRQAPLVFMWPCPVRFSRGKRKEKGRRRRTLLHDLELNLKPQPGSCPSSQHFNSTSALGYGIH